MCVEEEEDVCVTQVTVLWGFQGTDGWERC